MALTRLTMPMLLAAMSAQTAEVSISVQVTQDNQAISPLIYGTNSDDLGKSEGITFRRSGGNRLTGYNWENNASNAGSDWYHSSDNFLGGGNTPGKAITDFHDKSLTQGTASLVTLQAAGYVAKDKKGNVEASEVAPSSRWVEAKFTKGSAFSESPDTTDARVFMDEQVAFYVKKYGLSSTSRGIRAYSIDNEPALWSHTHPRIHPDTPSCVEIVTKNNQLAAAVKAVDPQAEVFGGVMFGYSEYATFGSAKDWETLQTQGKYDWFIDYFLDEARKASEKAGKRLIDVLDLHWYSEATGDKRITESTAKSAKDAEARVQAPRSFWDSTYAETSWISQWMTPKQPVTDWNNPTPGPIRLLPRLFASIRKYAPGTKLAFTEWNFGGQADITGGLATADVLGLFAREGVYAANYWPLNDTLPYVQAAFRLFRNADGKGLAFGSMLSRTTVGDAAKLSAYTAFDPGGNALHLVVLNKSLEAVDGAVNVTSPVALTEGLVYGFDAGSPTLSAKPAIGAITGNAFKITLPPRSASHIVLKTGEALPTTALFSGDRHPSKLGKLGRRKGPGEGGPEVLFLTPGDKSFNSMGRRLPTLEK